MGTRNLTMVTTGGITKVAQYGQWDGYPDGQGKTIIEFLRSKENIEKLKTNLSKCRFLDEEGVDKEMIEEYTKVCPKYMGDPDPRTPEQLHWWNTYMARDLGGEILENIAFSEDEEIIIRDSSNFASDSLFCEWAYVVDLDANKLEVYEGFNKSTLNKNERFFDTEKEKESGYYPIKISQTFDINNLPTNEEFFAAFTGEEIED